MARGPKGRKDVILDEATRLFAERGFDGTSMADLAERVGLRKASLFHHFASKEELRAAVLERLVRDVGEAIASAAEVQGDYAERLDALTDAIVTLLGEHPFVARLLLREAMEWKDGEGGEVARAILSVLRSAESFIDGGQKAGVFAPGDAQQTIITLVGLHFMPFAIGSVMQQLTGSEPWSPTFIEARKVALRSHVRCMVLKR